MKTLKMVHIKKKIFKKILKIKENKKNQNLEMYIMSLDC